MSRAADAAAERMAELSMDFMLRGAYDLLERHGVRGQLNEEESDKLVAFLKVEASKAVTDFMEFCDGEKDGARVRSYFAKRMFEAGIEGTKLYLGLVN